LIPVAVSFQLIIVKERLV